MEKIFVAGGSGFVGSHTIPLLVKRGYEVVAVVRNEQKAEHVRRLGAEPLLGDIRYRGEWQKAVQCADVVVNVAFPDIPSRLTRGGARKVAIDYLRITRNLVQPALRSGNSAYIQSAGVQYMPDGGEGWIDDKTPRAWTIRGFANITAPAYTFLDHWQGKGLPLIYALFPTLIYGNSATFRERFLRLLSKGRRAILGKGDNWMSVMHVEDAASALVTLVDQKPVGETVIISDGKPVRQVEFVRFVADLVGARKPLQLPSWLMTPFLGKVMVEALTYSSRASNRRLQELGFIPKYKSYLEGIPAVLKEIGSVAH